MIHVGKSSEQDQSWCGVRITDMYFKNAEFAALSGLFESKSTLCPQCVDAIIECLQRNRG